MSHQHFSALSQLSLIMLQLCMESCDSAVNFLFCWLKNYPKHQESTTKLNRSFHKTFQKAPNESVRCALVCLGDTLGHKWFTLCWVRCSWDGSGSHWVLASAKQPNEGGKVQKFRRKKPGRKTLNFQLRKQWHFVRIRVVSVGRGSISREIYQHLPVRVLFGAVR